MVSPTMFIITVGFFVSVSHSAFSAGHTATCNGQRISFNELCCNGVVQKKTGMMKPMCCLFNAYDSHRNHCCYDTIHKKSGKTPACCGREMIDETKEKCCENNTISTESCTTPSDSTCNDKRKSFTELCCHGALTSTVGLMKPACCGFIAFDSQTNICCHGEIHPKADKVRPACCGRGVYDESKEVCCTNNRVLPGSSCS